MKKRVFLLVGPPGIGKTTIIAKTAATVKAEGYTVGGMITQESRLCGTRVGFSVTDVYSGKQEWLAHVNYETGVRFGKYHVDVEALDAVGVKAVMFALENCDVIVIDEVGPMELFSANFRMATRSALQSSKMLLGVVHWKARDALIDNAKSREDAEVIDVTYENRDRLPEELATRILALLSAKAH